MLMLAFLYFVYYMSLKQADFQNIVYLCRKYSIFIWHGVWGLEIFSVDKRTLKILKNSINLPSQDSYVPVKSCQMGAGGIVTGKLMRVGTAC